MSECTNGEMRDLLPELVSGRLSAEMRVAVEAHVAGCEECAEELALLRALRPALMRAPAIDTARIAAAVRAQAPALARRASSRRATPWRLAIAAGALIAVSAIGYAIAVRGGSVAPEVAVVQQPEVLHHDSTHHITAPAPAPPPKAPTVRTTATPALPEQIAVAPKAPLVAPNSGVLDNVADLPDDDVRTLTAALDGMSAIPSAEPAPEIDPLGATLDDRSAGGSR